MAPHADRDTWYRQPILWLGAAILAASLAGCIWLIVVSLRYDESPGHNAPSLLGVPTAASSTAPPR